MLSVKDLDLAGKSVFLRVDFNVPLDENLNIRDDTRIRAALPTLEFLLEPGRPRDLRVTPGPASGKDRTKAQPETCGSASGNAHPAKGDFCSPDVIGNEVEGLKRELQAGQVLLLENLRFHQQEKSNDEQFAKELARNVDYYVNDAFGSCHRAHASVVAITHFVKKTAAGFLVEKEVEYLKKLIHSPERPFTAILGGAKVSDKIPVIENLINKADNILIGGAMAYTFFAAQGF